MLPKLLHKVFHGYQGAKQRRAVKTEIKHRIELTPPYLVLLAGSGIIATLGLLIDSSAVVIGAMIIAPLFWPMLGVAFGIADANLKLLAKSLLMLVTSLLIVIIVSFAVAYATPLTDITNEIALRINPTVLDLGIALVSSLIGVLALYYPTISTDSVGVALSLSIMPPLATIGIGFALKSRVILQGAFQLFLANMAAVIFMGVITLFLLKIRPDNSQEKKRFIFGLFMSTFLIVIIAIPLTVTLKNKAKNTAVITAVVQEIEVELSAIDKSIEVLELEAGFVSDKSEALQVTVTALVPSGIKISRKELAQIEQRISSQYSQVIIFDWHLISTQFL